MSLLLQESANRPEQSAGFRSRTNNTFYGLRNFFPFQNPDWYGPKVPLEWMWSYPDIIYDRLGVVPSGEV